MKKLKNPSIDELIPITLYHSVLCKFENGKYRLGKISYKIVEDKVIPIYCPETLGELSYSGKKVIAYEDLLKINILDGWHGSFTDDTEPKKNEECIVLVQEKKSYGERFKITYACYDGKTDFYGYKNNLDKSVIGFKHIRKENGTPY